MDFSWTKEQEELHQAAIEFGRSLGKNTRERDHQSVFNREDWQRCAEFGIQGLFVPQDYGGMGMDLMTSIYVLEGLGYGCPDNGLTFALNGQMWSVEEPLLNFGSEAQKQRYLSKLCSGEMIAAHGMTEPQSGSDAFSLHTQAKKVDGGYVLNGEKEFISLAPVADVALVFAQTNPKVKQWGVSAFLVERNTPGYLPSPHRDKMGLRTSPFGGFALVDCFVPEENRLAREGSGVAIFTSSMEYERSFIFASHVGAMARQLEKCIAYANERQQFGQSIGQFQSVSNRIADMRLRLETSRLLLYKSAWQKQAGHKDSALTASMAKLYISEAYVASSLEAIRTFGAAGYITESEIERDLRDSIGGVIYSGTSDLQRNFIARIAGA